MINRFFWSLFRLGGLAPSWRARVNEPIMDPKTRADIRRQILTKLAPRLQNLGMSSQ
jgi:hypothetical protein